MGPFDGKVAFITGGARGQGREHALALARGGADIVATDIAAQILSVPFPMSTTDDLAETAAMVEGLGRKFLPIRADVRSQSEMDAAVSLGLETFGHIDIVIANAGIWSRGALWDLTDEAWQDMIDVNLTGVWRTIKAVAPSMIAAERGGSIILTSSVNGLEGGANYGHYVASKHGVIGLMRTAALELSPYGIRCNAVCPGFIDTQMTDWQGAYDMTAGHEGGTREEHEFNAFHWHALAGRGLMPPESVSGAVTWLASNDAKDVTGIYVAVDGGHSVLPGFSPGPVRTGPRNEPQ
jgi:SDR family mycofactocin-dependent oxidoreductase